MRATKTEIPIRTEGQLRKHGTFMRLVHDKQFGFLRDETGKDYFFHYTELQNTTFAQLVEGQSEADFLAVETPKGWRANEVVVTQRYAEERGNTR